MHAIFGKRLICALALLFSFAPCAGSASQSGILFIAKVSHLCGERRYILEDDSLTPSDRAAIQDIISYLYSGANVLLEFASPLAPVLKEKTRKSIAGSSHLKIVFMGKHIENPTSEQVNEQVQLLYLADPVRWNIHEGPEPQRLTDILNDRSFSQRLGATGAKLIQRRLSGQAGQRAEILAILKERFGVKEIVNNWSDENCHIGEGFGTD